MRGPIQERAAGAVSHPLNGLVVVAIGLAPFAIGAVIYLAFRNYDGSRDVRTFGRLEMACRRISAAWVHRDGSDARVRDNWRLYVGIGIFFMAVGVFLVIEMIVFVVQDI